MNTGETGIFSDRKERSWRVRYQFRDGAGDLQPGEVGVKAKTSVAAQQAATAYVDTGRPGFRFLSVTEL